MSLLERVVAKTCNSMGVVDQNAEAYTVKLLNHILDSASAYKADFIAIGEVAVPTIAGDVLKLANNVYTVTGRTNNYHMGSPIRAELYLILNNAIVNVIRQTVVPSAQGGVSGKIDTLVWQNVSCKVLTQQQISNKQLDITLQKFTLMLSIHCPVVVGDRVEFSKHFTPAKVEGIKYDVPGIQEITFDKDPRWV